MSTINADSLDFKLVSISLPRAALSPTLHFEAVIVPGKNINLILSLSPRLCPAPMGRPGNWLSVGGLVKIPDGVPPPTVEAVARMAYLMMRKVQSAYPGKQELAVGVSAAQDDRTWTFEAAYCIEDSDLQKHIARIYAERECCMEVEAKASGSELATHELMDKFSLNRGSRKSANSNGDGL